MRIPVLRSSVLGAFALCASLTAHAAGGNDLLSKDYDTCMDKAGGVTASMISCMAAETKAQDVKLNASYQQLMSGLTAARKKELTEVQRMWLKYREANCKFHADPDGGTLARVNANACFMTATAARAEELKQLAE